MGWVEDPDASKNQTAVALTKFGGQKDGKTRARKLLPKRPKAIATKVARVLNPVSLVRRFEQEKAGL